LTGDYWIRVCRPAFSAAERLFPKLSDWMELRSQVLKLRYWPKGDTGQKLVDLDWEWVKALGGLRIGELRVNEIGGLDNIRVIFFQGDARAGDPLPILWVIHVMQKKRMDFTENNLRTFKARRQLVLEFYYKSRSK
jgi:hypothetical protein